MRCPRPDRTPTSGPRGKAYCGAMAVHRSVSKSRQRRPRGAAMETLCKRGLSRREALLAGIVVAAVHGWPGRTMAAGPLQMRVGIPEADAAGLMAALAPPMQKPLGMPVEVVPFRKEPDGRWPIAVVFASSPDSPQILVAGAAHLFSFRKYARKALDPSAMTKITKLTRGESFGLVVPRDPPGDGLGTLARLVKG